MSWRQPFPSSYVLLLVATIITLRLGLPANERMTVHPVDDQRVFGQASGDDSSGGTKTYQRIQKTDTARAATYGFHNFNKDRLEVTYQIAEKDFQPYSAAFGYTKEGLTKVKAWRENARQTAFKLAVKKGHEQSQLDAAIAAVDKEYDQRVKDYLASCGFRMGKDKVVTVDMPGLIKKHAAHIKPLSLSFEKFASSHRYRSPDIIGAVLSFVQTALYYKQPDPVVKEKHTGGVLPPVTAVLEGWGDCDTKTGLLGSILSNWTQMKMVGVSVPGHYLMGVLLIPEKGDLFLEHLGLQYVLVEPAGPAWLPPGQVGEETAVLLNSREGYMIEPFF